VGLGKFDSFSEAQFPHLWKKDGFANLAKLISPPRILFPILFSLDGLHETFEEEQK
jgi:hypothetical protein